VQIASAAAISNIIPIRSFANTLQYGPELDIAQLHWNENFYGPSQAAIDAMQQASLKGAYYPDALIKKLIASIAEHNELEIENITLSAGSTQALSYLAQVNSRKNPIATPQLGWDAHLSYAENIGGVIIRVDNGDNLEINLADIEAIANKNISSVSIVNPNNPTGLLLDADQLRASVRRMSEKTLVIVDEAYNEITDKPEINSMIGLVNEGHNVAISRTFSKIYGLAGQRVGYIIAQPDVIESIKRNGGGEFAVSLAGVAGALASFNDENFLKYSKSKIIEAREMVNKAVKSNGLTALPSQTNFVFVNLGNIDADDFRDEMLKHKILIRGKYGNFTSWSRVSMGNIEDVQRYVDAMPKVLDNLNNTLIT